MAQFMAQQQGGPGGGGGRGGGGPHAAVPPPVAAVPTDVPCWKLPFESSTEVKLQIRGLLGEEGFSKGHVRLVTLPLVHNVLSVGTFLFHSFQSSLHRSQKPNKRNLIKRPAGIRQ